MESGVSYSVSCSLRIGNKSWPEVDGPREVLGYRWHREFRHGFSESMTGSLDGQPGTMLPKLGHIQAM